jgi:signal peptidase I
MTNDQYAPTADSSERVRKRARFRSHFWPGAGFALLGYPWRAVLGTAIIALMPLTLIGAAFSFSVLFLWAFLVSFVIYSGFYTAEQLLCRSIPVQPGGARCLLSKLFLPLITVGFACLIVAVGVCFLYIGNLRVGGRGMMPTLHVGDYLLYQKHVFPEDLHPGHLVFFKTTPDSAWGKGGDIVVARILATPGQKLSIQADRYLVDGTKAQPVSPLGKAKPSVEVPEAPQALAVPAGCYFVVQDDPQNSFDSRVLSWARESEIIGTRAVILMGHTFGKQVQ